MNRYYASVWMALFLLGIPSFSGGQPLLGAVQPPELHGRLPDEFRYAVSEVVDKVNPVVVSIQTTSTIKGAARQQLVDPFEFFFGPGYGQQQRQPQELPKQQGLGSGVIISSDGIIVTNNHVVDGADQITVTLSDKRSFDAKIVGTDKETDVAVIQLKRKVDKLPVAYLGSSDSLRVGEWVVAIGNPYGLSHTVTMGIVSAKGVHNRGITSYENFIQTDAAINPGNSGGAMFDLNGRLVGINTAILSQGGGFQGIGFAIPIDLVRSVTEDLLRYGKVSRGWLGVSIQDVSAEIARAMKLDSARGALINEVFDDTPAKKAGLQTGDVVLAVDGKPIEDANALRHTVAQIRPGSKSTFTIRRNEKHLQVVVTVASRSEDSLGMGNDPDGSSGLGIEVVPLDNARRQSAGLSKDDGGVVVNSVRNDGAADRAGIQAGDIVLNVNGRVVRNVDGFRAALTAEAKADALLFFIRRGKTSLFIAIEPEP